MAASSSRDESATVENDKASEITAAARLEARRVTSKVKQEVEECKRELNALIMEKRRFLRASEELAAAFAHTIEDAAKKLNKNYGERQDFSAQEPEKLDTGKVTALSFSTVAESSLDDDEAAIS